MDSKELRGLCEAYSAIYDEDLRDELEEMSDEFAGIEDLTDEEIDTIVEETIDEMLEEGYDFDEVEEIFEGVLLEMNPYAPAGSKAARQYAKSTTASKKGAERSAARAATVAKVKGAVKSFFGKARDAARKVVDEPARKYAEKTGVVRSKSGKSSLGSGTGIQSVAYKQKTPEGRREVRSAVAKDIKGRIKHKIAKAQVGAYSVARSAGQAASDVARGARQNVEYTATRTKRGVKSAIRGAAEKVASKASKVAARMATEEVDVFDIVLEHLIAEGFAETEEAATVIMANMSEEWRDEILDEANKAERELGLSSRAREQARNLNRNADKPIFYKNTLMGKSSDSNLNKAHKQMTAKRQASHKAGRHLRGDTGEKGNVVKSRYQANKDHTDGYPSITKRGQGPT